MILDTASRCSPTAKSWSDNGSNTDFALVRYNTDGSRDTSFDGINTLNETPTFAEDGAPIVLDSDVAIQDAELRAVGNYAGASLTLVRQGGASGEDVFGATGNLAALSEGGNLVLSGVTIGTVTQNSAGTLLLTFDANATQARINEAMRSLSYSNSSDAPPSSVTIEWTFSDGNTGAQGAGGPLTANGSTIVTINSANDAPTGAPTGCWRTGPRTSPHGDGGRPLLGFSDADGDVLEVDDLAASSGSVVDNLNGTSTITHAVNLTGERNVKHCLWWL